jgi:hypothetical protein
MTIDEIKQHKLEPPYPDDLARHVGEQAAVYGFDDMTDAREARVVLLTAAAASGAHYARVELVNLEKCYVLGYR